VKVQDQLVDAGFSAAWSLIRRLPEPVTAAMFERSADVLWRRQGSGVLQLRANLSRVLPPDRLTDLDAISQDATRRYLRYWQEAFRLPAMSTDEVTQSFSIVSGLDHLDSAMDSGSGAIMALPHMGNWDMAGAWATTRYGSLTTVAERLKPESLYDRFVAYRESLGMEILPLGGTDTIRQLADRLRQGGLVCLLADRDLNRSGVPVQFFDATASMPPGPAMLSIMTGAPLMAVSTWHVDGATHADITPPISVPGAHTQAQHARDLTQRLADEFAVGISQHPADWHMMQKLWHDDLDS
jgi:lauroyl/myristoyl acyltransferase